MNLKIIAHHTLIQIGPRGPLLGEYKVTLGATVKIPVFQLFGFLMMEILYFGKMKEKKKIWPPVMVSFK